MIKIVIAYDDNDFSLGEYFEESYNNFLLGMQVSNETPSTVLRGLDCNEATINSCTENLNESPFVFVGLSHGGEDYLGIDSTEELYVSITNTHNFKNSFFYTTACKVGMFLGGDLINKGCKVFIGYGNTSYAPSNEEFNSLFIDCELHALKQFLATNKPINELFNEMLSYTQEKIDWLFENNEIIEAMDLQSNKDCMLIIGDGSLRKENFELN